MPLDGMPRASTVAHQSCRSNRPASRAVTCMEASSRNVGVVRSMVWFG